VGGRDARAGGAVVDAIPTPASIPTLEDTLREMEPALPAPPETLLTPEEFEDALEDAAAADGVLPHYDREQRRPKSERQLVMEEHEARMARGAAAIAKEDAGGTLTDEEFADECYYLDPASNQRRRRRSR